MHTTNIYINKAQFIANLNLIRNKIGSHTKLCLPVKANAYGHGLVNMAQIAAPHVDYLAVACLDEGIELRRNGIRVPILVFGAFDDQQISALVANNLEITITSLDKAKILADYCYQAETICQVHVKIDTGMGRVGASMNEAEELINFVASNPVLEMIGVYSHLAASDSPNRTLTELQIERFTHIAKFAKSLKPEVMCHLANSGGVIYYPESYFDMVRPGIVSYGYPAHPESALELLPVKPCLQLVSHIMQLKQVAPETGISYGHRYVSKEQENIATIAIGYGDGFRRSLSTLDQHVLINGKKYPIVGNICMDMLMVSLGKDSAQVGDKVIIIGSDGLEEIQIRELSDKLHTIDYEILVGFTSRIPRIIV